MLIGNADFAGADLGVGHEGSGEFVLFVYSFLIVKIICELALYFLIVDHKRASAVDKAYPFGRCIGVLVDKVMHITAGIDIVEHDVGVLVSSAQRERVLARYAHMH